MTRCFIQILRSGRLHRVRTFAAGFAIAFLGAAAFFAGFFAAAGFLGGMLGHERAVVARVRPKSYSNGRALRRVYVLKPSVARTRSRRTAGRGRPRARRTRGL